MNGTVAEVTQILDPSRNTSAHSEKVMYGKQSRSEEEEEEEKDEEEEIGGDALG